MDSPPDTPSFLVDGDRLTPLPDGPARMTALIALIDGAERSLRLLYYIYADDAAGRAVRDALLRAAERGVAVAMIVDGFGLAADAGFFDPLAAAGATMCRYEARWGRRYLLRNHQKLALADEARALVGGFNIEDDYFGRADDGAWRDFGLLVEGDAAARLARYFDALLGWTQRPHARFRDLRAIERIARRGGTARVMTAAISDNNATIAAARHCYRRLLARGVAVLEYHRTKLHTKMFVIDDVVHVGSANFDVRSLYLNLEVMLRIDDPAFAAHMRGYFADEAADSHAVTAEDHRRIGWFRRVQWGVANFIVAVVDGNVTRRLNFGIDGR